MKSPMRGRDATTTVPVGTIESVSILARPPSRRWGCQTWTVLMLRIQQVMIKRMAVLPDRRLTIRINARNSLGKSRQSIMRSTML